MGTDAVAGMPGPGLVTGTMAIYIIRELARDFRHRRLSRGEKRRVEETIKYAAVQIKKNLEAGKELRQDDFFLEMPGNRAAAEEIVEGVLLAAQRTHQEKKLPYYGNLISNIGFRPDIDRTLANTLIGIAERLTYYQYGILSIAVRPDEILWPKTTDRFQPIMGTSGARAAVLRTEMNDLERLEILNVGGTGEGRADFNVYATGLLLAELMGLQDMDIDELRSLRLLSNQ
jgi:hypothetical protein